MTYTLNVKEIGKNKFHYTVTDENGNIESERKSNRVYVACTIDSKKYFSSKNQVTEFIIRSMVTGIKFAFLKS